jgi:hypothetical protein
MKQFRFLSLTFAAAVLGTVQASSAQTFDIEEAGEVTLGTDNISSPGLVRRYFGMNVTGIGQGIISVRAGSERSEDPYEFILNNTRMVSYLLAGSLGEELSPAFRRGVTGTIDIELRDTSGAVHDVTSIELEVKRSRRECAKFPSKKVKRCAPLDLDRASASDKRRFLTRFVRSIRGPIILEP